MGIDNIISDNEIDGNRGGVHHSGQDVSLSGMHRSAGRDDDVKAPSPTSLTHSHAIKEKYNENVKQGNIWYLKKEKKSSCVYESRVIFFFYL